MPENREPVILPDLVGYNLDEAAEVLTKLGFSFRVDITKPIFATEPIGGAKVVRLKMLEDTQLQVVVAYQDYLKGGA